MKACNENRFIALRHSDNDVVGINCKVVELPYLKNAYKKNPNKKTSFVSYYPIDFSEYIRIKATFIPSE